MQGGKAAKGNRNRLLQAFWIEPPKLPMRTALRSNMAFAAELLVFVLELLWDLLFEVAIHQTHRAGPKKLPAILLEK